MHTESIKQDITEKSDINAPYQQSSYFLRIRNGKIIDRYL